jgi:uncharacterized protein (TIGR01777 family)
MKILITGASGLIGRELRKSLEKKGHELLLAGRRPPQKPSQIKWTAEEGFSEPERLEGLDAVIHLAGESISGMRWTEEKKKAIRESRVRGTRSVVDTLAALNAKPKVFISGSAIGIYGNRGDELMTEAEPPGDTFLADVCKAWEAESLRAVELGIRTVLLRTGIVLSKEGGALGTMLTPFKLGVGGVVGSGKQWMSWISLADEIAIINFVLENDRISGPINLVSPNPVTNEVFTKTLGELIHRPTILPLPGFAVKMVFGEMGDALLLDSTRAVPKRLQELGYEFKFPDLRSALTDALK